MDAPIDNKVDLPPEYEAWAAQAPRPGGAQPIIFVASEGGASRAAYWTAAVLAGLQDRTGGQFSKSVFSITAVSGGSVGAVGFLASLTARPPVGDEYWKAIEPFVGADFLSPALAGMLFPDLTQRVLPVALLPDRAETMERSWEAAWSASCRTGGPHCGGGPDLLARPFLSLWSRNDGVWRPALLIEGASEEAGKRILTTNLSFLATQSFTDADDFHTEEARDVPVSTAILNGARYPWISPAGTLVDQRGREAGHIVDGGYFDASGAETTRELAQAVARLQDAAANRLLSDPAQPFIFLLIGNCATTGGPQDATLRTPAESGATRPTPQTKRMLSDLLSPMLGLYSARDGHQAHLTEALIAAIAGAQPANNVCQQAIVKGAFDGHPAYYVPIKLCPSDKYAVPLDWVLSTRAKAAMLAATGYGGQASCLAGSNLGWLVNYLTTGRETIQPRGPPRAGS
jgi:hypothetical protein